MNNSKIAKNISKIVCVLMGIMMVSSPVFAFNIVTLDDGDDFSFGSTAGVLSDIEGMLVASVAPEKTEVVPVLEEIASIDVNTIVQEDSKDNEVEVSIETIVETATEPEVNDNEIVVENEAVAKEVSEIEEDASDDTVVEETIVETQEVVEEEAIEADIEEEQKEESSDVDWENSLMADVDDKLNVRTEPSTDADLAGKIRKGDLAEVIEVENGWYKISSGNLEGYVSEEFCVIGDDAKELSEEVCNQYATVLEDGLRIREDADTESSILDMVSSEESILIDTEADEVEGWVAVVYDSKKGYVNEDYVTVDTKYGTAITLEEEQAAIAAAKAEEAKKKGAAQRSAVGAGADEVTLLGAIIQCEAGNSGYEGQLAVGSVVCNRARRGYAGGSISGVIYQPGQFPPATNGIMAGVLSRGVSGSCMQAAQAALSGVDNTGGAVNFRSASSGMGGTVIGGNVFF